MVDRQKIETDVAHNFFCSLALKDFNNRLIFPVVDEKKKKKKTERFYVNSNNNNELYLHDHTNTYSIAILQYYNYYNITVL